MVKLAGESYEPSSLDELVRRMNRGDLDLVAVGRPLLPDPNGQKKSTNSAQANQRGLRKKPWANW